jgi:hypothetical protein
MASESAYTSSRIKSIEEADKTESKRYRRWNDEITMAEKEFDNFRKQGRTTVRRYKDERDSVDGSERKFNIFTANVGILESSLYAKIPKVTVSRRFGQSMDDPARVASLMLQNAIMQDIDEPECDFDQVMRDAVQDRLVPGLGTAWLRLETDTQEETLEEQWDPLSGEKIQEAATFERVNRQEVCIEHVFWEDFLYSPCRTWKERRWVARRVYMDRDALEKRFPDVGKEIPLDFNPRSTMSGGQSNEPKNDILQKAVIYEIWDRQKRKVIWISKAWPEILDEVDDPLHLEDFEPCPKPLFALTTTSNCIPVNDFVIYQDQYNELDLVNNRISLLVQACKVVGVYDSGATGVQRMLQQGSENTMIPVDNWAMFAEKGGVKGAVDWLPLETVIQALERLRQARDDIKGQIYELTGISDVVRGNTKASETLGAQNLKAQYASVRIQKQQDEVARFAQDILRIKGEIICRHFVPEQILKLANMEFYLEGQNAPLIHAAVALLKGDHEEFEWRVNVQADSLAMADHAIQKQEKVEFTNAVATFLQSAATTMKAMPDTAPILFETLKFAISGFKGSQELEGVIDQNLQTIMQKIQNPPPPPPDPAIEKAKMDMEIAKQKAGLETQKMQQELAIKQKEAEMNMAVKQQELAFKQQEHQMDLQFKAETNQQKAAADQAKFDQQIAQDSAKGMIEITKAAREDNKEESE